MAKRRIMLGLVCVVVGLVVLVLAAPDQRVSRTDKASNTSDVADTNSVNVAMEAFKLRMAGRVEEAKQLLEKTLAAKPGGAAAQFELARVYFYMAGRTKDMDLAQKTIKQAIKADPESARYRYWAGMIAMYNAVLKEKKWKTKLAVPGQMNKAKKAFERAVDLKPDYHKARKMLVQLYNNNPWYLGGSKSKAKEHEKKLEQMGQGTEPDFGRSAVLRNLGRRYLRDKKYDQAEQIIQQYLGSKPEPPVPLRAYAKLQLARVQKMRGKEQEAKKLLKQANKLDAYRWSTEWAPLEELFAAP